MTTLSDLAPAGAHLRNDSAGQGSVALNKWHLLKVIEDIREPLGLKATSIAVLRAMLSFIRSDEVTATRDDAHICFASNAALAGRAHVSVQTVERHISKLVDLGLLTRKSSGNGKRWARRDGHGRIVLATGLSLLPLVRRHAEFLGLAQTHKACLRDLKLLRDRCSTALADLKRQSIPSTAVEALQTRARKLLRRKPDGTALADLLVDITEEIARVDRDETKKMRATDPRFEGQKETSLTPSVKEKSSVSIEVETNEMEQAYPRLCAELRQTRTQSACHRQMDELAAELHLGSSWNAIRELGPALSFMVLGYLLERIETIEKPQAYAWFLLSKLREGHLHWRSLLTRPKRQAWAGPGVTETSHSMRKGEQDGPAKCSDCTVFLRPLRHSIDVYSSLMIYI